MVRGGLEGESGRYVNTTEGFNRPCSDKESERRGEKKKKKRKKEAILLLVTYPYISGRSEKEQDQRKDFISGGNLREGERKKRRRSSGL